MRDPRVPPLPIPIVTRSQSYGPPPSTSFGRSAPESPPAILTTLSPRRLDDVTRAGALTPDPVCLSGTRERWLSDEATPLGSPKRLLRGRHSPRLRARGEGDGGEEAGGPAVNGFAGCGERERAEAVCGSAEGRADASLELSSSGRPITRGHTHLKEVALSFLLRDTSHQDATPPL